MNNFSHILSVQGRRQRESGRLAGNNDELSAACRRQNSVGDDGSRKFSDIVSDNARKYTHFFNIDTSMLQNCAQSLPLCQEMPENVRNFAALTLKYPRTVRNPAALTFRRSETVRSLAASTFRRLEMNCQINY
jgi:hypothetical protein